MQDKPSIEGHVMTKASWPRCETCDFHGPELPTFHADHREFHRALHFCGRTIAEVWHLRQAFAWLNSKLAKVML